MGIFYSVTKGSLCDPERFLRMAQLIPNLLHSVWSRCFANMTLHRAISSYLDRSAYASGTFPRKEQFFQG